jgi:hypothetical protein
VTSTDPFSILGIAPSTDESVIRAAWRREAKKHHPDVGGTEEAMRLLNEALEKALLLNDARVTARDDLNRDVKKQTTSPEHISFISRQVVHDRSSFTIDLLPVDSFECVRLAGSMLGSIIDEECPYVVEFSLENSDLVDPHAGWCRCELFPEAGGTMVHLTVGAQSHRVTVEHVRDCLIDHINSVN